MQKNDSIKNADALVHKQHVAVVAGEGGAGLNSFTYR